MIPYLDDLTTGITGVILGKFYWGGSWRVAIKDGAMLVICDIATNKMMNLSDYIPLPGVLASFSDSLSTGIYYALGNRFVMTTSPFGSNVPMNVLYGMGLDKLGKSFLGPALSTGIQDVEDEYL